MTACIEELKQRMERNPFFQHMGFEIVDSGEKEILLKLPVKKDLLNTNHSLHGGVHASMLDMVQSLLLRTVYQGQVSVINQDVHYFVPVSNGNLFARAKVIQKGFKVTTVESEIIDEGNQLIAKGMGVYKINRHL